MAAALVKRPAQAQLGVKAVRLDPRRGPVGGHRLLVAAALVKRPAQAQLGVEAVGIQSDGLAQGAGRLAGPAQLQQRVPHAAMRRGPAELVRKEAGSAPPCAVRLWRHEHRNDAFLNPYPVRLDSLPVPAQLQQRVA